MELAYGKLKLNKTTVLYMVLFIPYLKPESLVIPSSISLLFAMWRIISCSVIILLYLKRFRFSKIILLITVFEILLLINSVLRYGSHCDFRNLLVQVLSVISLSMLAERGIVNNPESFFDAVWYYGVFICALTAVTMFLYYPEGMEIISTGRRMTNYYLMGVDNASYFNFFVINIIGIVRTLIFNGKISKSYYLFYFMTLFIFFYTFSVAAILVHILLGIFIFLFYKIKLNKINYLLIIESVYACSFFLVVFRIDQWKWISEILIYLSKGTNLNGRGEIWEKAIQYIKDSFLFGYGHEETSVFFRKFYIDHLHNIFLDVFYSSGLIGFLLLTGIIVISGINIRRCDDVILANILSGAMFLFLLLSNFDYYNSRYLTFLLYLVLFYCIRISKIKRGDLTYD